MKLQSKNQNFYFLKVDLSILAVFVSFFFQISFKTRVLPSQLSSMSIQAFQVMSSTSSLSKSSARAHPHFQGSISHLFSI